MNTAAAVQAIFAASLFCQPTPANGEVTIAQPKATSRVVLLPRARTQVVDVDDVEDTEVTALGDRSTTEIEYLIGEIRAWALLKADWDDFGAVEPSRESITAAVNFVRLLNGDTLPRPMLHSSGRAGLFWRDADLRADLEFYPDGRITFYAERGKDKYKGVVHFDGESMPAVFPAFLNA